MPVTAGGHSTAPDARAHRGAGADAAVVHFGGHQGGGGRMAEPAAAVG
ncbi:hypothetical protein [Amycolatopsis rifamycinica]|nr:hypothetical protein [Amycolatopsis rifamycinica]